MAQTDEFSALGLPGPAHTLSVRVLAEMCVALLLVFVEAAQQEFLSAAKQ